MNKKISKIFAVALAFVLCFAMATPAFAAGNYTGMTGTDHLTTTFDKYLVMDSNAKVPNVKFNFSITAGTPLPAANGKFEVLKGVFSEDGSKPSISNSGVVSFASNDATFTTATAASGDYVKGDLTNKKYAKQTAVIDFTGVVFKEPGVYRYVITEDTTAKQGIVYDTAATRILDVYVEDASTDTAKLLKIAGYVFHATATQPDVDSVKFGTAENTAAENTAASDYKSQGFTNEYISHDLTFKKTVSGNQASRDKYFKFTVTITGALPNTKYNVNITNAEAAPSGNSATTYTNMENPSEIETDATGAVTQTFYLQHNQYITIEGLTDGALWEITEDAEGYKSTVVAKEGETALAGAADTDGIHSDSSAAFDNYREGVVPTGVLLTVAPFAVLMLVGIAGAVAIILKKKRTSDK